MGGPTFLLYGWPHVFIIWVAHSFHYMGGQMILLYGWPNQVLIKDLDLLIILNLEIFAFEYIFQFRCRNTIRFLGHQLERFEAFRDDFVSGRFGTFRGVS